MDSATGTRNYLRSGLAPASDVVFDGSINFTPGISERSGAGQDRYYNDDALGSATDLTDLNGNILSTRKWDAFGNLSGTSTYFRGWNEESGYEEDSASGLRLLGYRYYDPTIGRFLTPDPIGDGSNWYAYCGNDPIGSNDPMGLERITAIGAMDGVPFANFGLNYVSYGREQPGDIWLDQVSADDLMGYLINASNDADFMFYGHGNRRGNLFLHGNQQFTIEHLKIVNSERTRLGKKRIKVAWIRACLIMSKKENVNTWLEFAETVHGYPGLTAAVVPGAPLLPLPVFFPMQTWTKPITSSPPHPGGNIFGDILNGMGEWIKKVKE